MLLLAIWPVRAKTSHIILAELDFANGCSCDVERSIPALRPLLAEAALKLRANLTTESVASGQIVAETVFDTFFGQKLVTVEALFATVAVAVLFVILAKRLPVLEILVQECALVALFAETLQEVDANLLFVLRGVLLLSDVLRHADQAFCTHLSEHLKFVTSVFLTLMVVLRLIKAILTAQVDRVMIVSPLALVRPVT